MRVSDEEPADLELDLLSGQLRRSVEELTLVHELSRHLDATGSRMEHCRQAVQKLAVCLPIATVALILTEEGRLEPLEANVDWPATGISVAAAEPMAGSERPTEARTIIVQTGEPIEHARMLRIDAELANRDPAVINGPLCCEAGWDRAARALVEKGPWRESRLLAVGSQPSELGTPEIHLMQSVAMILSSHLAVHRQMAEMRRMFEGTVRALVSVIDAKDAYTSGHSCRVSDVAEALAGELGHSPSEIEIARMAGLLHDIGKIGVPDAVLRKPGKLDAAELAEIRKHPQVGYEILRGVREFSGILPAVRHHHESWDGRGYPDGLTGEGIPSIARILAVADALDAMTSTRPYRPGMPAARVQAIFRRGRGHQWDARVVDALLNHWPRMLGILQGQPGAAASNGASSIEWNAENCLDEPFAETIG